MTSRSQLKPEDGRPLWLIAFALLIIAICMVLLVLRFRLGLATDESPTKPSFGKQTFTKRERPLPSRPAPVRNAPISQQIAQAAEEEPLPEAAPPIKTKPADPPSMLSTEQRLVAYSPGLPAARLVEYFNTTIVGKVVLEGTPPPEINISASASCRPPERGLLTTRFFVVGTNRELADTLVFIRTGLSQQHFIPPQSRFEMLFTNCQIEPYVGAILRGQRVLARNIDGFNHFLHATPTRSPEFNYVIHSGETLALPGPGTSELFVRFKCDVHPWEFAYLSVFDHPFFAVTDKEGNFAITNVPPGQYLLEAFHRKAHTMKGVFQTATVVADQVTVANFTVRAPSGR